MSIENFDKDNFKKDFKEYFSFKNTIDDYNKKIKRQLESVKEELEIWAIDDVDISWTYDDDIYIKIRAESAVINYKFFKQLEELFDTDLITITPYDAVVYIDITLKKEDMGIE